MSAAALDGALLESVSRSFYLSIRILPAPLRAPIALGYLLARASDTIADSADLPAPEREQYLAEFLAMIEHGGRTGLSAMQSVVHPEHPGEGVLIQHLGEALDGLERLQPGDAKEVRWVLQQIIRGQTLDVQRFGRGGGLAALQSAAELEEYTWLVAGCVGEFWTRLCQAHLVGYSRMEPERLLRFGAEFGQALQLVNILRDQPEDLRQGRCYLPADEFSPDRWLREPAAGSPTFARWRVRAETLLKSGREYIVSLRAGRVRAGCYLPWELARRTLARLEATDPLSTPERIKVPRAEVRVIMLRALLAAFSNFPLR